MKHEEICRIIEECANQSYIQHKLNPWRVLYFQYFSINFWGHVPHKFRNKNCHYLRDSWSHASLVFNDKTKKISLLRYWTKEVFEYVSSFKETKSLSEWNYCYKTGKIKLLRKL